MLPVVWQHLCDASCQANRIKVRSAGCVSSAWLATCWDGMGEGLSLDAYKTTNPTCSG
jgi:hypothetical protein